MFAHYQTVDYDSRVILGNGTGSTYASSVLADWVGMLTGTITLVSQLSSYADKTICTIQGAAGDWAIYDNDAHPSYPGACTVLRRLRVDGLGYQYMYIGFRMAAADYLNGFIGYMGGWDSATKSPTTRMSGYTVYAAGTVLNSTQLPMNSATSPNGTTNSYLYNQGTAQTNAPIPWKILSTPSVMATWPESVMSATTFPCTLLAEYQGTHPWSTPAAGHIPLLYSTSNVNNSYPAITAPNIRNAVGNLVLPDFVNVFTAAGNSNDSNGTAGVWWHASTHIYDYTRDANGNKVIPFFSIDVSLRLNTQGYFCYAGRLLGLYGTMPTLNVSDTFTVGGDTYVVIPTGAYNASLNLYSTNGKLCAKIA